MENIWESWIVNQKIAHRGLHNEKYPENSIGAFKNAIKYGFAIELDVHLISTGELVVIHDHTLDRTTNKTGSVENLKGEEIKDIILTGTKEKLPTLKEVLEIVDGKVPLMIEIKNVGKVGELESKLYEMLKEYKGEYAVQSFNPLSLKWFKENAPEILRGQLSGYFKGEKSISFITKFLLKRMLLNGASKPHFINYDLEYIPNKYVQKYKNIPLLAYTIRDEKSLEYANKNNVSNVIFENFIPKSVFNK